MSKLFRYELLLALPLIALLPFRGGDVLYASPSPGGSEAALSNLPHPTIPAGLLDELDLTWKPFLKPACTVEVHAGSVTDWRTGLPVPVTIPGAKQPLVVALELCANNVGDWVALYDAHAFSLGFGSGPGNSGVDRASSFQGISIVGIPAPQAANRASLKGMSIYNKLPLVGQSLGNQNQDLAFLNFDWNMANGGPGGVVSADQSAPMGHLYFEQQWVYSVSNDFDHLTNKTPTTRCFRFHGGMPSVHMADITLKDAETWGDNLGGASEHGVYADALQASEFVRCYWTGCQLTGFQLVTRYTDRIDYGGGVYGERIARGALLIKDCTTYNCGNGGSWNVNICGGLQDVLIWNHTFLVDEPAWIAIGGTNYTKWAGGAIQTYFDSKMWELDPSCPAGQGPAIAQGYSMGDTAYVWSIPATCNTPGSGTQSPAPQSPGVPALLLPQDGFSACRSLTIVGGTFKQIGTFSNWVPVFAIRDCADVQIWESKVHFSTPGSIPLQPMTFTNVGPRFFAKTGLTSVNGTQTGNVHPTLLAAGYAAQAALHAIGGLTTPGSAAWMASGAGTKMSDHTSGTVNTVTPTWLDSWLH